MADYLFVSQEMLDNWMMQGKIDFSGTVMTIRGDKKTYVLEPAVRFVRVVGEEPDAAGLLAKVKTLDQVVEAGGEHYHDSVVLGDVAYEVQNGFIARVNEGAASKAPAEARADGVSAPVPQVLTPQAAPTLAHSPPTPLDASAGETPPAAPERAAEPAPAPPEPATPPAPAARPADPTPAASAEKAAASEDEDAALLTEFLLDNLR